jgi:hypothetical protein
MNNNPRTVTLSDLKTIRIACRGKREAFESGVRELVRCGATFELSTMDLGAVLAGPGCSCPFCQTPLATPDRTKKPCSPFERLAEALILLRAVADRVNIEFVLPVEADASADGSRLAW